MFDVRLSPTTYQKAVNAALAEHVSVEQFIEEAVQLRLAGQWDEPESLTLTAEQLVAVRQAQVEVRSGRSLSLDDLRRRSAEVRASWREENRS